MKSKLLEWVIYSIIILFQSANICLGQTIINAGPVSGTWTAAGSPYHIMGDIEVPNGEVLVIEPGVSVKIYSDYIFGNL